MLSPDSLSSATQLSNRNFMTITSMCIFSALLIGCGPEGGATDTSSAVNLPSDTTDDGNANTEPTLPNFLTRHFVENFGDYASSARELIDSDTRYTVQLNREGTYIIGGKKTYKVNDNPIRSAGVHYAHAAGLTGAGQTIAISDVGFLSSHETLTNKPITLGKEPGVDDHGTQVASIAAGSSSAMVGVAPGASLILGNYGTYRATTEVANLAREAGAVALNNSWSFVGLEANQADYNTVFGNSQGAEYLAALKSYAGGGGVVLWAASNERNATVVGIMAALPNLEQTLEAGWLAIINGLPTMVDDDIVSATRLSGGCLEAAAWCLAADGTWIGAQATSNTAYGLGTGTSFATPVVSGALALLGEAFPDLTPQQLRIRLLASADNTFVGFTKSGSVELVTGFSHDISTEWGHGFVDVAAALMPIGGTTIATASGDLYPTSAPLIVAGTASGDAVEAALDGILVLTRDAIGAGFEVEGRGLVARRGGAPFHAEALARLGAGLGSNVTGWPSFLTGALEFPTTPEGDTVSVALPMGSEDFGISVRRELVVNWGTLGLSAGLAHDGGRLLPTLLGRAGATLVSGGIDASFDIGAGTTLAFSAGTAMTNDISLGATGVSLSSADVFGRGDRMAFGFDLPTAITRGTTTVNLPVRAASGGSAFQDFEIGLAPAAREMKFSVDYTAPLARKVDGFLGLEVSHNRGHVAGELGASAIIGVVARF